jgi:hypothetical protein
LDNSYLIEDKQLTTLVEIWRLAKGIHEQDHIWSVPTLLSFINQHAPQVFVCKSIPDKSSSTVTVELSLLSLYKIAPVWSQILVNQVHTSGTYGSAKHSTVLL